MLRSDINIVHDYIRDASTGRPTIAEMKRGYIQMDSADLVLYHSDGDLVGSVLGIPVYREADLANGKFAYYDAAGNSLLTNV